jgi:plastocyanin
MDRRTLMFSAAAVAASSLPAWAQGKTHIVRIEGMKFVPATVTVRAGDRIAWRNQDVVPHTATAAGHFDSGAITSGKAWTQPAPPPGRYDVVCVFHPGMKAVLVVQ